MLRMIYSHRQFILPRIAVHIAVLLVSYTYMCIYKTIATSPYKKQRNNSTCISEKLLLQAKQRNKQSKAAQPRQVWAKPESPWGPCCSFAESLWSVPGDGNTVFLGWQGYITKRRSDLVTVSFFTSISQTKPCSFLFHHSKLKPLATFSTLTFLQT